MIYVKKENRTRSNSWIFFYLVFFVIVVYIAGYLVNFFSRKKINTRLIEFVDVDDSKIFNGIIIRNEKVYKAEKNGFINLVLHDGDYAKKGNIVCLIEDRKANDNLKKELLDVNNNIVDMQKKRIDVSIFKNDIKKANDNLKEIINKNMFVFSQMNNTKKINNVLDLIEKNLEVRNQILLSEHHGSIKNMSDKRNNLEKKITGNIFNMIANESGLVSYDIDGLENNFLIDNLERLNFEKINIKSQTKRLNKDDYVSIGNNIFKIIEANDWYIACCVKGQDIKDLKKNDAKFIYLNYNNDFIEIEFTVYKILKKSKHESILVLKSDKFMHDFVDVRNIKFKLDNDKKHGYKILTKSISHKNLFKIKKNFIYKQDYYYLIKKGNESNKIRVKVYDTDENYFYVDSEELKLNDVIVKENNKKDEFVIKGLKKIHGIYLANSGIAEFKKINFDGDLNKNFVVLDEKLNPEIKIYDIIVSDIKNISDGQKIVD